MAHTPGPWAWRGNNTDLRTLADKGEYNYGIAVLALEYDGDGGWEIGVSEANARLIAAAPEMLEALKAARDAINTLDADALGWGGFEQDGVPYHYPLRDELLSNINKAIAKAEGKG